MNITSKGTMIFAKEFNEKIYYRAGFSSKTKDGEYKKAYMDVRFPKGTVVENKTKINIKQGFLTFDNYIDKENNPRTNWYIVIQDFETDAVIKQEEKDPYEQYGTQITVEDLDKEMDLPF